MTIKVSSLMGMDVYTDNAKQIGKVYDIIIDLQKGEVVRLTLEPIKATNKEDAKRIFKDSTILYKNVKAADRIIIVTASASNELEEEPEVEAAPAEKAGSPFQHYSYRYKR